MMNADAVQQCSNVLEMLILVGRVAVRVEWSLMSKGGQSRFRVVLRYMAQLGIADGGNVLRNDGQTFGG